MPAEDRDGPGWVDELELADGQVRVGQVWIGVGPGRPGRHVMVNRLYDPALDETPATEAPMAHLLAVVRAPAGPQWLAAGIRPPLRVQRLLSEYRQVDPPLDTSR